MLSAFAPLRHVWVREFPVFSHCFGCNDFRKKCCVNYDITRLAFDKKEGGARERERERERERKKQKRGREGEGEQRERGKRERER